MPTYREILPAWWSFFWRTTVFGFLLGSVAGFLVAFVASLLGYPQEVAMQGGLVGYPMGILASIYAFRRTIVIHDLRPNRQ